MLLLHFCQLALHVAFGRLGINQTLLQAADKPLGVLVDLQGSF